MTIRDKIFDKLEELNMTQKAFSKKTGIAESTISDWKKKKTNPTADKIMLICKVLDVEPEWLLSGIDVKGDRGNPRDWYAIIRHIISSSFHQIIRLQNQQLCV